MTNPRSWHSKRSCCSITKILERFVACASGEQLAACLKRYENGGDVIFVRAVWVTGFVSAAIAIFGCVARLLRLMCSDYPTFPPVPLTPGACVIATTDSLGHFFAKYGPYLLQVFAGAYAAFYARFASQWSYLADLYNQIKAKEVDLAAAPDCKAISQRDDAIAAVAKTGSDNLPCNSAYLLAQWKIGFIEDAFTLHLARKELFASVITNWARDELTALLLNRSRSEYAREALQMASDAQGATPE